MIKSFRIGLIIFIGLTVSIFAQSELKLKVKTDNIGSSTNTQFTLPVLSYGAVNCTIDWGDGTTAETVTTNGAKTHTYTTAGTYTVSISGTSFPGIMFAYTGDRLKLLEVEQWGTMTVWQSMNSAFFGCEKVNFTAIDTPNWTQVTDYTFAFTNCFAITSNFAGYNVSAGQSFLWAWAGCIGITDFASLNFAAATTLEKAFYLCSNLQTFGNISIPNCTSLRETWWKASALTAFPVITNSSNVTDAAAAFVELTIPTTWPATDFSAVTDFQGTWWGCEAMTTFGATDTSSGQNFLEAFRRCFALTTLPVLDFSSMTDGTDCFRAVTLDIAIWNQILVSVQANNTNSNVSFSGGDSKRAVTGTQAKYILETDKGWTIIDAGADSALNDLLAVQTTSNVSPAHIEGSHITGLPIITADTVAVIPTSIDSKRFFAGIPLSTTAATAVSVVFTDKTVNESITWTETNVADASSGAVYNIRANDSLLLTAIHATLDGAVEIDGNGDGIYELTGIEGDKFAVQYATTGSYTIITKVNGTVAGTIIVNVIGVDFDGAIACEINYNRVKDINLTGGSNADIVLTGNDLLQVTNQASIIGGSTMNLMPIAAGENALIARLGGEFGPIIGFSNVDEFTFTSQASTYIGVVEEFADGSMLVETNLEMLPKVVDLEVRLHIFVSGVTFEDSSLDKIIMTDAFDSSSPALHPYQMIANPGINTGTCHTIKVYQNNVQIGD